MKNKLHLCICSLLLGLLSISIVHAEERSINMQASITHEKSLMMVAANPCMGKNPCMANNPCMGSNPCGAKNPCDAAVNPCSLKNPCSAKAALGEQFINPNLYIRPRATTPFEISASNKKQLIKEGERLFNDGSLGSNGLSCNTCHATDDLFKQSFAKPYPHKVQITIDRSGYHKPVAADEFVQFCIATPMAGQPLNWNSRELTALTAYVENVKQKSFMAKAANPCYMKSKNESAGHNPCMAKNPCAGQNPCMGKNPCTMKNPCAAKM